MSKCIREELGVALGRLVVVDYDKDGTFHNEFMLIKVAIDVFQWLRRRIQV